MFYWSSAKKLSIAARSSGRRRSSCWIAGTGRPGPSWPTGASSGSTRSTTDEASLIDRIRQPHRVKSPGNAGQVKTSTTASCCCRYVDTWVRATLPLSHPMAPAVKPPLDPGRDRPADQQTSQARASHTSMPGKIPLAFSRRVGPSLWSSRPQEMASHALLPGQAPHPNMVTRAASSAERCNDFVDVD